MNMNITIEREVKIMKEVLIITASIFLFLVLLNLILISGMMLVSVIQTIFKGGK